MEAERRCVGSDFQADGAATRSIFITKTKIITIRFSRTSIRNTKTERNKSLSKLNEQKYKLFKTIQTKMRLNKLLVERLI